MLNFLRIRASRRDESGAVAVMVALMTVMLMTVAALGTDIGNAVARRTDTQTQADYGAFAAAEKMSSTASVGQTPSAAVLTAVMTALNNNQPEDDSLSCWRSNNCVTSTAQLTDANLTNGDVRYTTAGLQVTAPNHYVRFGMAQVLGFQGENVGAKATVNVYSPGLRVLPMFAVQGCDYGLQTLADPANGHDVSVVPTLAFNTEQNTTGLVANSQVLQDSTGATVNSLVAGSSGNRITITASKWSNSLYVGFFRGDDTTPSLVQTAGLVAPTAAPYTKNPATAVTVSIPNAVTATQTVWYVRVYDSTGTGTGADNPTTVGHTPGTWSKASEALPIRVGNAVLQCNMGSTDGNFGTLKLPRTDVPTALNMPANIADGLQSPLSLTKHQQYVANGLCTNGVNGAVESSGSNLYAQTNCVATDTGLAANDATQGLISGYTSSSVFHPGLLTTAGTKTGCDPTGGSSSRSVSVNGAGGGTFQIDNATLTCYLTNGSTSLQTICDSNYSGPSVLDKTIVDDPRFVWVPVLKVQPSSGGSLRYSIVDIRPGFITDETVTNATIKGTHTATSDNGVTVANNGITILKVVFFNINAMPTDATGHVIDYLGVGPPIVRLVQ
jgi:Flp pilus assembly protein TadG